LDFAVRLTLLVPELIWPEPGDQSTLGELALPGLEVLLARAAQKREAKEAFETTLAGLFGMDQAPFGALRLLGETEGQIAREGHWLCADPVHLRFHHERIILADAGAFDLEEAEAEALIASLNTEFADIGEFRMASARRWYLRLAEATEHAAPPLSAMAGKRIDGDLAGKQSKLARWLNEVQMFLHGHPVNAKRQAAGQPAINSLWLWGAGPLPAPADTGFAAVWSNDPLAAGLARAAGIPAHPAPTGLDALLAHASPDEAQLVVLDSLLPHVLYEDGDGWRKTQQALDEHWFAPLDRAIGRQVAELTLIAPTIYGKLTFAVDGKNRWKFWQRLTQKCRPLAVLAKEMAEGNTL
jgi:hypothetical protein